jgi:polyphosphate kinase 2 (PPK2 family)
MDSAGRTTPSNVISGVNRRASGLSFKEHRRGVDHDFLADMRASRARRIGIFNRSYYEETLSSGPSRTAGEAEDPALAGDQVHWSAEDINALERYLTRNGFAVSNSFSTSLKRSSARSWYV